MIIVTRTFTRLDRTVPWHLDQPHGASVYPQEFQDYVDTTYRDKKLHHTYTLSEDGLTITLQSFWQTMEDYRAYNNDPICIASFARRDAHNAEHNITNELVTVEEV